MPKTDSRCLSTRKRAGQVIADGSATSEPDAKGAKIRHEGCLRNMTVAIAAFYKFVRIDDPQVLRNQLFDGLSAAAAKGTILVAAEGINGTISAAPDAMATFLESLQSDSRFGDLAIKASVADTHPFQRLKVKVKAEIIRFGQPEADPSLRVGIYVAPSDWNALIAEPDVLVVDTRNAYEVAEGTFAGAVNPQTRTFSDWPAFVAAELDPGRHRRVAMFCTGGIRCEKASAYLLARGFAEVYHLQGGVLNYLAHVPRGHSQWQGTCFVFDERETVDADTVAAPDA
jgi:UPF0176 protein